MAENDHRLFIAFAAEDRYTIAEPLVYHLKNYGVNTWYDRHALLMGDNRKYKNLEEGARASSYACIIISKYTEASVCAVEEIEIIRQRYYANDVIVFPVLYEISPEDIPNVFHWVKEIIYKEVNRMSGTRETCNHIACKISENILAHYPINSISRLISLLPAHMKVICAVLYSYNQIDHSNINSRVSLLYATSLIMNHTTSFPDNPEVRFAQQIFNRLFSETQLNIAIDYRETWLLENALCILANYYLAANAESNI